LTQDWIQGQWAAQRFITSLAVSPSGELLVVTSQGTRYSAQLYRCSHTFPSAWIARKWRQGFHVTALACAPWSQAWAVVMSAGAPFGQQALELDLGYPGDGIQQLWAQGLHVSACAASKRENVFVLSRAVGPGGVEVQVRRGRRGQGGRREGAGRAQAERGRVPRGVCAQETARSPAFPVDHITANWQQQFYISALCHGPVGPGL